MHSVLFRFTVVFLVLSSKAFSSATSDDAINGEYILMCSHGRGEQAPASASFFTTLEQQLGRTVKLKLDVSFGALKAYLLSDVTAAEADVIRQQHGLRFMELNRRVRASELTYHSFVDGGDDSADFMELNRRVRASELTYHNFVDGGDDSADNGTMGVEFCYEQNTGRNLWGLSRVNQREALQGRSGRYRWSEDDDGAGVDVYVLDSGCNVDHEEFGGRARHGFTASQIALTESDEDLQGHGTHVSGTIAAMTFGVAKAANIIAVKVLNAEGAGSIMDIVEGLSYVYQDVTSNAKTRAVVNLSLGAYGVSTVLEEAVNMCLDAGINVVVAAGNDFDDACSYTPADIRRAITVGASGINDQMSSFSNYGTCVDIFAPGETILSTYIGRSDAYAIKDGTSMAAPHVSGVIARYLSRPASRAPSPDDVARYLDTMATRDAIDLSQIPAGSAKTATANKLLYIECSRATTMLSGSSRSLQSVTLTTYSLIMLLIFYNR